MSLNVESEILILFFKIFFLVAAATQLFYYLFFYARMAFYKAKVQNTLKPPVSVIIAARNEYENLSQNLPGILQQDYPEFEVIVVNDGSWDDTSSLLEEFSKNYQNFKTVVRYENDRFDGGKKVAIMLGIKAAKHERLLFTDADCRPVSRKWIERMVTNSPDEQGVVLGYSPYSKSKGLLNAFIRFDNWLTGMNYLSFAMARMPYMGVGRNLSYSKNRFFEIGGFKRHYHLKSGDDDLFVNEAALPDKTFICLDKDAFVETFAEKDWKSFWRQKKRHLSTSWNYKWYQKLLLAAQPLSTLFFFISAVLLMVFHTWMYIVLGVILVRLSLQIFIFSRSSRWLGQRDLIFFAPILEIFVIAMSGLVHIANLSAKQTSWRS